MKNIYYCFPKGKFKVLTMSYDDGKKEDRRLVSLFNRHNIKGTFHVNAGILNDPERIPLNEMKELYEGHEISGHTFTHPTIARCPIEQVVKQVLTDREGLEEVAGYPVRGLSYPNGSYNEEIKKALPHLGIKYARVVGNSDNFQMPDDFYQWQSTCHHNHNLQKLGEEFVALHKKQYLYMMYVWGHSYEFRLQDNWQVIEDFCELVSNKEEIWYATNIQIVDYMEVLDRLQFSSKGDFVYNPSFEAAWLSVDEKIIEIPGGKQVYL